MNGQGVCTGADTRCINNTCTACGGKGGRCCIDWATTYPIWCANPFSAQIVSLNGQNTCLCM